MKMSKKTIPALKINARAFALMVFALVFVIVFASIAFATSEPEGPQTLSIEASSRRSAYPAPTINASAGNITRLNVAGKTVTQSWQGFVGNASGTITLDDASNYTLYDWSIASPEGEVYATYLTTVTWTTGNILCWNWSKSEVYLQLNELEGWGTTGAKPAQTKSLGVADQDVDGVNETFTCDTCDFKATSTTHTSFYVGGQYINGSGMNGPCPSTKLYNGTREEIFEEVLLYQDVTGTGDDGIIYASLLQNSINGYDNSTYDFEMLVGEDGHSGDIIDTVYYFYVELE